MYRRSFSLPNPAPEKPLELFKGCCPNCGEAIATTHVLSKSLTCPSCSSLVQLISDEKGQRVGKAIAYKRTVKPGIPLGHFGQLDGVIWTVMGFQVREGNAEEDHFVWREYLLYNSKKGFGFLADGDDGWFWSQEISDEPTAAGTQIVYLGTAYRLSNSYNAKTLFSIGEFCWKVRELDVHHIREYTHGEHLLTRELAENQEVWTLGRRLSNADVYDSFHLGSIETDISTLQPWYGKWNNSTGSFVVVVAFLVIVFVLEWNSNRNDAQCEERYNPNSSLSQEEQYAQCRRSGGGGGGGSWGGHK